MVAHRGLTGGEKGTVRRAGVAAPASRPRLCCVGRGLRALCR